DPARRQVRGAARQPIPDHRLYRRQDAPLPHPVDRRRPGSRRNDPLRPVQGADRLSREDRRAVVGAQTAQLPPVSATARRRVAAEPIGPMPTFAKKSAFWREVKAAANDYLVDEASRGRPSVGDPRLKRKTAVILLWFGLSYGALLFAPTLWLALLATISLALAAAAIGFGVFHDANHGTLFRRPAANLAAARLCSVLLGPSRHFWVHKHQGLHHRQPNVFGWDDDLETRGMLRFSPECDWHPRFRRQQVKAVLYYGLNTLEWLFW